MNVKMCGDEEQQEIDELCCDVSIRLQFAEPSHHKCLTTNVLIITIVNMSCFCSTLALDLVRVPLVQVIGSIDGSGRVKLVDKNAPAGTPPAVDLDLDKVRGKLGGFWFSAWLFSL